MPQEIINSFHLQIAMRSAVEKAEAQYYQDDSGITFMNIYEFLLNPNSLSI